MPSEKDEYGSRYSKRGIGFWILVYVVIAIVLYGGYYLYRVRGSSQKASPSPTRSLY